MTMSRGHRRGGDGGGGGWGGEPREKPITFLFRGRMIFCYHKKSTFLTVSLLIILSWHPRLKKCFPLWHYASGIMKGKISVWMALLDSEQLWIILWCWFRMLVCKSVSQLLWSQGFFSHSLSGRIGLVKASDTFNVFQVLIKMANSHRNCQYH